MSLSARQKACLNLMGIDVWVSRDTLPDGHDITAGVPVDSKESGTNQEIDWKALQQQVAGCTRCALHQGRTRTVFGVGSEKADWMLIGEAPGAEEDRQGEPFVGRAGTLLNSMLMAIGLQRDQVYIANILKCRPPQNRDPVAEEVAACSDYLRQQIEYIRPRIILSLGRISAQNLLGTDTPIGKLRGSVYEYADTGIPLVVTYHPAYLLRSPGEKRKSWQDLQLAVRLYNENRV